MKMSDLSFLDISETTRWKKGAKLLDLVPDCWSSRYMHLDAAGTITEALQAFHAVHGNEIHSLAGRGGLPKVGIAMEGVPAGCHPAAGEGR